jgi:hypothetical protein
MIRQQLPVYSPVTLPALLSGFAGALGRNRTSALADLLGAHFSARSVVLTDSGTSALTLAMIASLARRKGPIALPAYNCYDLATAADGADASVVLYDIDPTTLAPDPSSFRRALEYGPSAVVVAHLFGLPVDVMALREDVARAGATLIEDAAQAAGATLRGVPAGAMGSLAVLSFGRGKGISGGGGGALLANDDVGVDLLKAVRLRAPSEHSGWSEMAKVAAQLLLGRPELYGALSRLPFLHLGETRYHAPSRLRGIARSSSAVVHRIWSIASADRETRETNALRLLARARAGGWETIEPAAEASAGWLRLPLLPARGVTGRRPRSRPPRSGISGGMSPTCARASRPSSKAA